MRTKNDLDITKYNILNVITNQNNWLENVLISNCGNAPDIIDQITIIIFYILYHIDLDLY